MSQIKLQIQEDMKTAMRAKEKERLGTIRLILAAFKQREVDERIELNDEQVLVILDKLAKQRRESISQFEKADRNDLVAIEQAELAIIQAYLPEALSDDEIETLIQAAIANTGAAEMKDMGKVMAELKPKMQGRADMGAVSAKIKSQLAG